MCFSCFIKPRCKQTTNDVTDCNVTSVDWQTCMEWDITDNELVNNPMNSSIGLDNITFINDLWLVVPTSEIIIKVSIFIPVVLWGVFGNTLLLYIIIKNRHLRTPTNLLIGNMAAADLITLSIHPWIFLIYDIFQNYQLGLFGCKTEAGFECAVLLSSVMNLVAISYDRLNAIFMPQQKRLTKFGAKIIMVVVWLLGLAFATPLFIFRIYKERQWSNFLEKYCTEDATVTNIYWHVIITMMVWLPLTIMLVCYITLFIKLKQYEQAMLCSVQSMNVNHRKKVAKMIFLVVITFMVCRLPFTALIFYRNELLKRNHISTTPQVQNQVDGAYHTLWFLSKYLIILNAAINPVIYGLASEKFRKAFKATAIGRKLFVFDTLEIYTRNKPKKRHKQENIAVVPTKRITIFSIFKKKIYMNGDLQNNESVISYNDGGSQEQIIK